MNKRCISCLAHLFVYIFFINVIELLHCQTSEGCRAMVFWITSRMKAIKREQINEEPSNQSCLHLIMQDLLISQVSSECHNTIFQISYPDILILHLFVLLYWYRMYLHINLILYTDLHFFHLDSGMEPSLEDVLQ